MCREAFYFLIIRQRDMSEMTRGEGYYKGIAGWSVLSAKMRGKTYA
jgi:hypothetical protein